MKARDFLANSAPNLWLVDGLIPHGHLVIMGGLPGSGKSWIVDALAISVAGDVDYLSLHVRHGKVLLVDEDTPQDELRSRLQRIAKGVQVSQQDLPLIVHSLEGFTFDNKTMVAKLKAEIYRLKPNLVIFDCLGKMMGSLSEDNARDANKVGAILNRMKESGATVLVVHHLNKGEGSIQEDFVRLLRGSGAWVANSDTAFGISLARDNPTTFNIYPISRRRKLGFTDPFGIELKEDANHTWALLERVPCTKEVGPIARDIITWFCRHQNETSVTFNGVKGVFAGMHSDYDLRAALKELEEVGSLAHSVTAHNKFVYHLPSISPETE